MDSTQNRLEEAMELRGMRQVDLSDKSGIAKSLISRYMSGQLEPKRDAISAMAIALQVNPVWLMGYDGVPMSLKYFHSVDDDEVVYVYGSVAAGKPMYAQEDIIGKIRCSKHQAAGCNLFALKIKGDSMSPKISDGDLVIVRQQEEAEPGDIVVAIVNGEEAVCKKFMRYANGSVAFISLNPAYEPIVFSGKEADQPVILGKVIEARTIF